MTSIILDVETTGIDEPEVIELAFMGPLDAPLSDASTIEYRYRPSKPITLGAMATHGIIEADLADCEPWSASAFTLPSSTQFLVGHGIDYDWKAIGSPDIRRICTLALARAAWPTLDSHKLSALIYHLYPHGMARELVKGAHNAAADVGLCYRVLGALWDVAGRPDTWERFWQISEKARVPKVMSFGKFGPKNGQPGMLISELRRKNPSYVRWLLSGACDQVNDDPYLQKALTQ